MPGNSQSTYRRFNHLLTMPNLESLHVGRTFTELGLFESTFVE
jgi:hypothetical protein